ncbi:hypothetical protein N9137_03175, partial [Pseudomonadales bacterium]|nr:hypothetical protein [Pseudomonadales bacterium]
MSEVIRKQVIDGVSVRIVLVVDKSERVAILTVARSKCAILSQRIEVGLDDKGVLSAEYKGNSEIYISSNRHCSKQALKIGLGWVFELSE